MDILFKSKKLKKQCEIEKERKASFSTNIARKLKARMDDIRDAACLEEIRPPFPGRCHELEGNLKGCLAIDLSGNMRLIF